MSETLVGRKISVYMDGGWELSGTVRSQDTEKLILESDEKLHMIFRKKVAVLIIDIANSVPAKMEEKKAQTEEEVEIPIQEEPKEDGPMEVDQTFPINPISYDESSMSIPMDVLGIKNHKEEENFSISFSGTISDEVAQNKRMPKISFRTEDE